MNTGSVSINVYPQPASSAIQNEAHEGMSVAAKNRLHMIAVLNHPNV
jgi:hypothetical protein